VSVDRAGGDSTERAPVRICQAVAMTRPSPPFLLVAGVGLGDPNFHQTVVLVLEWNDEGAFGLVLNRPTDLAIDEHLPEVAHLAADPKTVHFGGPVQTEIAIGLDVTPGTNPALVDLASPVDGDLSVRVFAGYSGWGEMQLDQEIATQAWHVSRWIPADLRPGHGPALWRTVLRRQPGTVAFESLYPDDLAAN
jgi:putative transcriptional regulator